MKNTNLLKWVMIKGLALIQDNGDTLVTRQWIKRQCNIVLQMNFQPKFTEVELDRFCSRLVELSQFKIV